MNSFYSRRAKAGCMDDDGKPDWLTEMDEEIIEILSPDLTLSPSIIAENIDRSREGVSNRLNSLQAGGLVDKVGRGKYQLSEEGVELYLDFLFEKQEKTDAQKIGDVRAEIQQRREIQKEFGVSKDEYEDQVAKEYERIQSDESSIEDPLVEAIERVETRLRKNHSYYENKKERLQEESSMFDE